MKEQYEGFTKEELLVELITTDEVFEIIRLSNESLKAENKILKDALEFYADIGSWSYMEMSDVEELIDYERLDSSNPRLVTGGKLARQTLEKIK
jgi:hypothetical protein